MKRKYLVAAKYLTRSGNPASCRRVVMASDHGEALKCVATHVHQFKNFMGKLDMNCVELPTEAV